jgi:hypothetical protein
VLRGKSFTDKDTELISNVNKIAGAVKVHKFTDLKVIKTELPLDYLEEGMMGHLPLEGRMLIDEYYKALFLNDDNPEAYNINYWENYFKISSQTLRNIFNYVFFPIPDPKNPSEVAKILYFKDFDLANRRKLISDMSSEEYKEYLEKTEHRPELEELKRLDYIKYQETATEPRMSDRTVPYTYEQLDEELENIHQSPLMQEVDKNIQTLVEKEATKILLDKDVAIALEQLKQKRIEVARNKMIEEQRQNITNEKDSENKNTKNSTNESNTDEIKNK